MREWSGLQRKIFTLIEVHHISPFSVHTPCRPVSRSTHWNLFDEWKRLVDILPRLRGVERHHS